MNEDRIKTNETSKFEISEFHINYELSRIIYDELESILERNKCYDNIFRTISNLSKFLDIVDINEIKVAYCLILDKDINMFNRHCCLLYQDKILDPTALFWSNIDTRYSTFLYYPLGCFSIEGYSDVLHQNMSDGIELYKLLLQREIELHNYLIKEGHLRNFGELGEFLERIYSKENFIDGLKGYQEQGGIILY